MHTVERLLSLPERPEITVVDNGSTDGTSYELHRAFPQLRVITLERNHGAVARTFGVANATSSLVAFSDDDSWWEPGALERAATILESYPRLAVVAARVLVGRERRIDPTCVAMAQSPLDLGVELPGPAVLGFVACGAVVRRDAYLECGGFSRILEFGGEEGLLALDLTRHGWLLSYVAEVVAEHHPSPVRDARARRRRLARNRLWQAWLRRPWPHVVNEAFRVMRDGMTDASHWWGLLDAILGIPAVVRERAVVPPHVEAWLQAIEAHRASE